MSKYDIDMCLYCTVYAFKLCQKYFYIIKELALELFCGVSDSCLCVVNTQWHSLSLCLGT